METPRLFFGDGWYGKENDGICDFRWMKKKGFFSLKDYTIPGKKYIRFIAGHSFQDEESPILEIFINGLKKDEKEIEAPFSTYAFLVEEKGDIHFEFRLNKAFCVPGDPRELGMMVRKIDVLPADAHEIFLDGWYEEAPPTSPFQGHWMKQEARCVFTQLETKEERYLIIVAGHPFFGAENPTLRIFVEGEKKGDREVLPGESTYIFPLDVFSKELILELKLNKTFDSKVSGDKRKLGVFIKKIEVFALEEKDFVFGEGCCEWEYDEFFPFRWMSRKAHIVFPRKQLEKHKYVSFCVFSEYDNFTQILTICLEGEKICKIPLLYNWNYYSVSLPLFSEEEQKIKETEGRLKSKKEIVFSLNKIIPETYHEKDSRELAVRLSQLKFHNDDEAHKNCLFFHQNALLNHKEMMEGKTKLESYPLNLGIDLYAKCNIKPPCVYCLWDWMKEEEGKYIDKVVDDKTLQSYGAFFRSARLLINCSIGEPLLQPRFKEILEFCQKHKKFMEISTNGQAFTQRTIKALVGKPVYLYISLDAASKETYSKIRNDRWESIIPNLVLLNQERKKKDNLPKIHMVFMPMRVNKDELEDYFRLCAKIEADALILRPLLFLDNPKIEEDRGGYHFDYKKELLSLKKLEEIFQKCEEFSRKYEIPVANQFSFGVKKKKELAKGGPPQPELPHF